MHTPHITTKPTKPAPVESMLPSFDGITIWPFLVRTDHGDHRVNAASEVEAKRKAIRQMTTGKRKGFRVHVVEIQSIVVTSEQMHRILD